MPGAEQPSPENRPGTDTGTSHFSPTPLIYSPGLAVQVPGKSMASGINPNNLLDAVVATVLQ
jgi:hypothetical protein